MTLLQRWMDETGKDEGQVATALGIDRSQVWRLRNAKSRPSVETAHALERLTKHPASSFLMEPVQRPSAKPGRTPKTQGAAA